MDEDKETLRREILVLAQLDQTRMEAAQAKMSLFASLAHGDRGNILSGSLTENRFNAFWDLIETLVPYEKVERPENKQKTAVDEDSERQSFVDEYRKAVESGEL